MCPGDTKSAFPEGAAGVSPWASEKIGRAGVRIERRSHLDRETSHEAFLQRPPLPAPVTGDSAEGPWREPPPRVTLGEKLMGLNVPQASQVQEAQEGQGHRAWLAAASQARSGCEFEGGRIAARPGLLSSSSPQSAGFQAPSLPGPSTQGGDLSKTLSTVFSIMKLETELPNLKKGRNATKILKEVSDGIVVISLSWVFAISFQNEHMLLSGEKKISGA